MPKKKKGKPTAKILLVTVVIVVIVAGVIAWHDGLLGVTEISDINNGTVSNGSVVTIKGEVTFRLGNAMVVSDGSNFVGFDWAGASPLNSIVVVRGTVSSVITLSDVTSVDIVWLFTSY